jgi:hypothetical protein
MVRKAYRVGIIEKHGAEENIEPKKDEVTGGWRGLHNKELHNLCT